MAGKHEHKIRSFQKEKIIFVLMPELQNKKKSCFLLLLLLLEALLLLCLALTVEFLVRGVGLQLLLLALELVSASRLRFGLVDVVLALLLLLDARLLHLLTSKPARFWVLVDKKTERTYSAPTLSWM